MSYTAPGARPVIFHLVHGGEFEVEMTPDELADTLRAVDHNGILGKVTEDGHQVWIRLQHVTDVTYPEDMGVDWLKIRDEDATPENPQEKRTGGTW
jgi:hypothetical protein